MNNKLNFGKILELFLIFSLRYWLKGRVQYVLFNIEIKKRNSYLNNAKTPLGGLIECEFESEF